MKYLYSNCLGSFVFDEEFRPLDKRMFSKEELLQNENPLEKNEWLDSEREFIRKYSGDKIFFIGFKKEKIGNVITTQDPKKLARVSELSISQFEKTRNASILITKQKIKNSVGNDLLAIKSVSALDELNKSINLLVKKLREWYELYNPEFSKSVSDNERFVALVLEKDKKELLRGLSLDEDESMGADFSASDLKPILGLARDIKALIELKKQQESYLESLMEKACPNINAVAGAFIGAKLINYAGSLENLAMMTSSKIQLLGAEKALFRHLKDRKHKLPKYGILHEHPYVLGAGRENRGKAARMISSKISIAAKVDFFRGEFVGDKLKKQMESRK